MVLASSKLVSQHWLNVHSMPPDVVQRAVELTGLQIAMMWPYSLYEGGLLGLERQVVVNVLSTVGATARGLGALLAMKLYGANINVFLTSQIVAGALLTGAVALALWARLPPSVSRPRVDLSVFRRIRGFALGMTGISVVSLVLTQLDKIILSKMLSLEHFAYYMLAAGVAASITNCAAPFFSSLLPRFVQMSTSGDEAALASLYHRSSQALSVVVIPVGCLISLFATDLVRVWTGDPNVASQAGPIVSLLVLGFMINSLMILPYALQLAIGWTSLVYYQNIFSVVVLVPTLVVLTKLYQGVGAAVVWLLLNLAYLTIFVPLTHRRVLRGEERRWYLDDIGRPFVIAAVTLIGARLVSLHATSLPVRLGLAAAGWVVTVAVCARTLPTIRQLVLRSIAHASRAPQVPRP